MDTETLIPAAKPKGSYKGAAEKVRQIYRDNPELPKAEIARRAGCSGANVHEVLSKYLGPVITESEHKHFAENKADAFERLQNRIVGSITDDDIEKSSLLQRATTIAILEDKLRTIRGQASSYNVTALLDLVESAKAIRDGRHQALPSDVQADNRGDKPK